MDGDSHGNYICAYLLAVLHPATELGRFLIGNLPHPTKLLKKETHHRQLS
jgi:hypothetical protein